MASDHVKLANLASRSNRDLELLLAERDISHDGLSGNQMRAAICLVDYGVPPAEATAGEFFEIVTAWTDTKFTVAMIQALLEAEKLKPRYTKKFPIIGQLITVYYSVVFLARALTRQAYVEIGRDPKEKKRKRTEAEVSQRADGSDRANTRTGPASSEEGLGPARRSGDASLHQLLGGGQYLSERRARDYCSLQGRPSEVRGGIPEAGGGDEGRASARSPRARDETQRADKADP
ncbi:hypothetical protein BP5796_03104 [Coleophoma crateriformis]|uniref:Uncharacterized protein n=1 Tax=Coleophoma crateriformis TaxID=565419 RepID=A0A3D8SM74_9HELO|nr:hypothetical protein BP5796_03104 [Coleophoma crateriformis]